MAIIWLHKSAGSRRSCRRKMIWNLGPTAASQPNPTQPSIHPPKTSSSSCRQVERAHSRSGSGYAAKRLAVDVGGTVLSRYQNILFLSEFMRCEKGKGGGILPASLPPLKFRMVVFPGRIWLTLQQRGRKCKLDFSGKAEIWLNYFALSFANA